MNTPEQYDARITRIMSKIEALRGRDWKYIGGRNWQPVWEQPLTEEEVAAFESKKGIRLPEDYRRFITTCASAGKQPFYGLYPMHKEADNAGKPFPYTLKNILYFIYMTEEEMDQFYDDDTPYTADNGLITLCTEGDGMDSVLVVNSEDPDTYGTVWYFDLANDFGIVPMYDPDTGKPFHFLDWLEYWADRQTALSADEYFSYSETVRLPDPPDNPDILGRKMGWIK